MNLIDSSGWLEYISDGSNADFFAPPLQDTDKLVVSTVNIYEVFKKILQQKDVDSALKAVALMQQANVVDVNSTVALAAAKLSVELNLPMADSIILATADLTNAVLWTQDSDFKGIERVRYVSKKK